MNRRSKLFGVVFAFVMVWLFCHGQSASAQNGAYPYPDKPCVWAPHARQGVGPNWCPNYDWGDQPGSTAAANVISPYGYYYRNCTDYAAWKVHAQGVSPAQYKGLGNAKDWAARGPRNGLRVDGVPAVGSVAVRTTGKYGHTAYVEEVRPDGTIRVSQYNAKADGNYSEAVGTPRQFGFSVFVHFEDYMPKPTPPPTQPSISQPVAEPVDPPPTAALPAAAVEPAPAPAVTEPEVLSQPVTPATTEVTDVVEQAPAAATPPEPLEEITVVSAKPRVQAAHAAGPAVSRAPAGKGAVTPGAATSAVPNPILPPVTQPASAAAGVSPTATPVGSNYRPLAWIAAGLFGTGIVVSAGWRLRKSLT